MSRWLRSTIQQMKLEQLRNAACHNMLPLSHHPLSLLMLACIFRRSNFLGFKSRATVHWITSTGLAWTDLGLASWLYSCRNLCRIFSYSTHGPTRITLEHVGFWHLHLNSVDLNIIRNTSGSSWRSVHWKPTLSVTVLRPEITEVDQNVTILPFYHLSIV